MMAEAARLQSAVKRWWEANPMTYDWKGTSPHEIGTPEFYREVDRRFWKAAWFGHEATNEPFSRLISYVRLEGKSVLEIGCGAGSLTERLARHSKYVTAIDLTKSAVDLTRRRFALHGLHGNILQMNGENLGFPDEAFDFVWSWGVIHHSANTERIVEEIHRVLKPGGEACVMVYNRNSIEFQLGIRIIRGVLLGGLLKYSVDELADRCSDGFIAKYYSPVRFREMFSKFHQVQSEIYGQKCELWQVPHGRVKDLLVEVTPDALASWLMRRAGSFLFVRSQK